MVLGPFATAADLGVRMNRTFTGAAETQVNRLLADASSLIRMAAGYQQISRVDNDTVTLRGPGTTCLTLPQRPVLDVTAVAGLSAGRWEWDGGQTLTRLDGCTWSGAVTVTYSHGLNETQPGYEVARSVACDAVKRTVLNPELVRSHEVDDFAETLVDARASLLAGEADTIRQAFAGSSVGIS
ncbi:hypothetical protein F4556_002364 [Kitasatospora gansuensis]|uniref:Uncharacterized protein n=1 Tax=Kitasatospora gansuensis TaxID=258050 RepID=A0A7W7WHT1_9ACTN|nr:hypothetical protein [Kitasatospora gansuensis]MBB4946829.1 hypothetical protein [Kitasatospora gansuensis]